MGSSQRNLSALLISAVKQTSNALTEEIPMTQRLRKEHMPGRDLFDTLRRPLYTRLAI
jgi:hypothetical protein